MEEMLDDTLEAMDDDEELEEEADEEVEKVLFDITDGKLGLAGSVGAELPVSIQPLGKHPEILSLCACFQAAEEKEEEQELYRTRQLERLNALLSD